MPRLRFAAAGAKTACLNCCPTTYQRTDKHLKNLEWCWRTEQTLFGIVEMCQFSFRFSPWAFSPSKGFLLCFFFSLDSCKSNLYLGSSHYNCVYICIVCLFAHIFDFKPPVNGEWIVHVEGCLTWCVTSLISYIIFLYQLAQACPHNVLHPVNAIREVRTLKFDKARRHQCSQDTK